MSTNWDRDSIPYVGVRGGFLFSEPSWLGLSVEVLHFKVFAETDRQVHVTGTSKNLPVDGLAPLSQFIQTYQVSNGVNMLLGNVEAHKRLGESVAFPAGRAELYVGAGAGGTFPFTRSHIDGRSQGQYEWSRAATQIFGGLAWHLSWRWDLSLEYKLTATTVDGSVPDGKSESRLLTNHVAFGVGFHFTTKP